MPDKQISLDPSFSSDPEQYSEFIAATKQLANTVETGDSSEILRVRSATVRILRLKLRDRAQIVILAFSVLCDLACQGWEIIVRSDQVSLIRPTQCPNVADERLRVRRGLEVSRTEHLARSEVRTFIKRMQTPTLTEAGWHSIRSLIRDGPEFASELDDISHLPTFERSSRLKQLVQPYIQIAEADSKCCRTGLRLLDIWRYFRYTWLNTPQPVPGRSMLVLVRDAATENHAVIGIAALTSSIVQQTERDTWIGWSANEVLCQLRANPVADQIDWLYTSLATHIGGVYAGDFRKLGILNNEVIENPSDAAIEALRAVAARERELHYVMARPNRHKSRQARNEWQAQAESHLFVAKRAQALSQLLSARKTLRHLDKLQPDSEEFKKVVRSAAFANAVKTVTRHVKAAHVGVNMLDISVCGAIAPYNAVVGGKLIGLLCCSPEIRAEYKKKYDGRESIIASSMKGKGVRRPPDLVLLCTTGLFGKSIQYNRISIDCGLLGGTGKLEFKALKCKTKYGTFHFSESTMREMKRFNRHSISGSSVNNIFGEGVNPKMRRIREALDQLGFPSDEFLKHSSPRSVYVIALAKNFRELLLEKETVPVYMLPERSTSSIAITIASLWSERWFERRAMNPVVRQAICAQSLSFNHDAIVKLPADDEGEGSEHDESFEDSTEHLFSSL